MAFISGPIIKLKVNHSSREGERNGVQYGPESDESPLFFACLNQFRFLLLFRIGLNRRPGENGPTGPNPTLPAADSGHESVSENTPAGVPKHHTFIHARAASETLRNEPLAQRL